MNDEICCVTNNGKMASDDPSFLWTYTVYVKN